MNTATLINRNITPVEKLFFRSSKIGLLVSGLTRAGLTEKQAEELERLQEKYLSPKGLTEKQYLTYLELIAKKDKQPELSQGAKTAIKEIWLENEKGYKKDITNNKLKKGLQGEEDAINLISYVDNVMYIKNETRKYKDNITGECDILTRFKNFHESGYDALVIDDLKCSWDPLTFMSSDLSTVYEWQGRSYLYLYDADVFRLRYCLVDCPPDILSDEYKRYCFANNIIDDSLPQYKELIDQFNRNYLYENSGKYTKEERVKTFQFARDLDKEAILLQAVKLAVEYYQTITLNMK